MPQTTGEVLEAMLNEGGLETKREGDRCELVAGGLVVTCRDLQQSEQKEAVSAAVRLELEHPETNTIIRETAVGVGPSLDEALQAGFRVFRDGMLFTIIKSLVERDDDPEVQTYGFASVNKETGGPASWDVYQGPAQVAGSRKDELLQSLEDPPLFFRFMDALSPVVDYRRIYWIKVYAAQQADGKLQGECLLNNENWPEGLAALEHFNWPKADGFMMFRKFFVLLPTDDEKYAAALEQAQQQAAQAAESQGGCLGVVMLGCLGLAKLVEELVLSV